MEPGTPIVVCTKSIETFECGGSGALCAGPDVSSRLLSSRIGKVVASLESLTRAGESR